jgi:phosphatidylinositol alpha-mannosyltransferase
MKIAILGENYYPTMGGIQEHIYNQAKCFMSLGHEVCVITGMPKVSKWMGARDEEWVKRVGRSVRFGAAGAYSNFTFGPIVANRLRKLFQEQQFDILHIHGPFDFGLPMLAFALFKGPIVATLHSAFKHALYRTVVSPYFQWAATQLDAVIAVSELAAACMLRYANFDYEIIPNGVDVSAFERGRRMAQYDDGRKNIVYLGRLEPRAGPDLLIRALPQVIDANPNARVIIAGSGLNGTAEHERMVPPDLRDKVVFLGAIDNDLRSDLYATADVFVLPARFGGSFSIMVLEALASGVPVVSTPFVAEKYRNSHWKPVKLCVDYSPSAIAKGINSVLTEDSTERVKLGKQVVQEYDWPNVGKRILQVYKKLLPG